MANDDTLQNMIEVCLSCQSFHVSILALFSDSLQLMQVYQRHKLAGSFKPTAFREEAALLSDGENMFAFQICNHPSKDEKILHYEFLGCISEEESGEEEGEEEERESNKRGETISFISHTLCILVHKTCTLINVLLRCQVLMR
jgi:hypothetical protein